MAKEVEEPLWQELSSVDFLRIMVEGTSFPPFQPISPKEPILYLYPHIGNAHRWSRFCKECPWHCLYQ